MRFSNFVIAAATLSLAATASAQDRQRISRECRQQIVKICGTDRAKLRACLRENVSKLDTECRAELRQRMSERRDGDTPDTPSTAVEEISFGSDALQKADYWRGSSANAPLVLFVHGGGWKRGDKKMMSGSAKLSHWQAKGYAVASTNYRLVPANTVEDQARDVAASVAYFRSNAQRLGIDADRIVLVGHSAGAHLVSLVGTDPQWLSGAGLRIDSVAAIIPLDGAGYYVPDQMNENARLLGDTYQQAFGDDPARQEALSPTAQATAPNAPEFLILHVERDDSKRQSEALGAALLAAETPAQVIALKGRGLKGHREINENLGEEDYPATAIVDRFLARILAQ